MFYRSRYAALVATLIEFAASSRHPFLRPVGTLTWGPARHIFHDFLLLCANDSLSCQIFPINLRLKNRRNGVSSSTFFHLLLCSFLIGFADTVKANNDCKTESSPQLPSLGTALIEDSRSVDLWAKQSESERVSSLTATDQRKETVHDNTRKSAHRTSTRKMHVMPPSVFLNYSTHTTHAHADRGHTFGKPPTGGMSWMGGKPLGRMLMVPVLLAWSASIVSEAFL